MDEHATLGGSVCLLVGRLPLGPCALGGRQFVPNFGFIGVVVDGDHGLVGRGNKEGVAAGGFGPLRLRLGFLRHGDVVGDAFGFFVKSRHLTLDSDSVNFIETAAIFTEVGEECRSQHFGVEGRGVLHILVPPFFNGIIDECNAAYVGIAVEGAVVPLGSVFPNGVLGGFLGGVRCNGFLVGASLRGIAK